MFERMPNYKIFITDKDKALLGKLAVENDLSPSSIISKSLELFSSVAERNAIMDNAEKVDRNYYYDESYDSYMDAVNSN